MNSKHTIVLYIYIIYTIYKTILVLMPLLLTDSVIYPSWSAIMAKGIQNTK